MSFSHSPSIVTNGLIMCLDAANRLSYLPGTNLWRDLSGRNNSAPLVNGPTFSSENLGSIVFDGTDDVAPSVYKTGPISSITISLWGYKTSANNMTAMGAYQDPVFFSLYGFGIEIIGSTAYFNIPDLAAFDTSYGAVSSNQNGWANWVMVYNGSLTGDSNRLRAYYNGTQQVLTSFYGTIPATTDTNINFQLGKSPLTVGAADNTRISMCHIYNRALSASEVLQNFQATKSRYYL